MTAMGSELELKNVCQRLDQVTLDFFDTLELLYQSQAKLEALMRSGFLSLSRARYSMGGTRNVGALQFSKNGKEMEALNTVDVCSDEKITTGQGDKNFMTNLDYRLVENYARAIKAVDCENTDKPDNLRQRKGVTNKDFDKVETVGMQTVKEQKAEKAGSEEKASLKDPLTLFGVLVSPHLRQCQVSFKQAVAMSVEIANLRHKLQGLRQHFQLLLAQKKDIKQL